MARVVGAAPTPCPRSSPSMTTRIDRDGSLVAALRRGDPTAAEDLVAAYGDGASRLADRITGNAQDAEEVTRVPLAPKAHHQSFLTSRREKSASVRSALNRTNGLHLAGNLL